jgi:hypothetical protein
VARRIGHPTLIWQCAAGGPHEGTPRDRAKEAYETAQFAVSTIQGVADRLTDPALRASFVSWSRAQAVDDHLDRLRRA